MNTAKIYEQNQNILNKMEYLKIQLAHIVLKEGLTSSEAVKVSQELDQVMNLFQLKK